MPTNPTINVPGPLEATRAMSVDTNESASSTPDGRDVLIIATDPDDPQFDMESGPDNRSLFVTHFPFVVDTDGWVKTRKDGVWQPAGECDKCGDLGPARFHCVRCHPHGWIYTSPNMGRDEVLADPRKMGAMAHLTNSVFLEAPDPVAARSHFLMLLDSYWADDKPKNR
jgi:hypothetical protein